MNAWDLAASGRERRILAAILTGTLLVTVVLCLAVLLPLHRARATIESDLARVEEEIDALGGEDMLARTLADHARMKAELERLEAEWDRLQRRVDSFRNPPSFTRSVRPTEEGRIDFKVALYEARAQLLEAAEPVGVTLPERLGVGETIAAHENAEIRLYQLAVVVQLVEKAIEIGVDAVEHLAVLPPFDHMDGADGTVYAREFPVRVDLAASFEQTMELIDVLLERESFLALRSFRAERVSRHGQRPLEVTAVFAGESLDVRPAPAPPAAEALPAAPVAPDPTNGTEAVF